MIYAFLMLGIPFAMGCILILVKAYADKISNDQTITHISNKNPDEEFSAMDCPYCGAPLSGRMGFVVTCSSCGMKTKLK